MVRDKKKQAAYMRSWYKTPAGVARKRRSVVARKGLTLEQYSEMWLEQLGACAICGGADEGKELAIDHNHETQEVRGLLCQSCNNGLGRFKDDPSLLIRAVRYLRERS